MSFRPERGRQSERSGEIPRGKGICLYAIIFVANAGGLGGEPCGQVFGVVACDCFRFPSGQVGRRGYVGGISFPWGLPRRYAPRNDKSGKSVRFG